jgi:divinyl chlorophyllide a 8-vinyl-reductase
MSGRRILVLGATGTIGQAVVHAAIAQGDTPVCLVRRPAAELPPKAIVRRVDAMDASLILSDGIRGECFDAVISCLASRTGVPADAWAVDHDAQQAVLAAAQRAAIRVQRPRLAFQHAKLAFEAALAASGIRYSIVRPTAYFKSLSGQVERVRRGKPYLLFGDGTLTACKPISDDDLARFLIGCIDDPARWNRVLPIGGPGPPITPREQGERLFALLGKPPRFRQVSPRLLLRIARLLAIAGRFSPRLRAKAELARIGHYYATESMLVLDPATGRYDADATPSIGTERLFDHYARLVRGEARDERGDHAMF